MSAALQFAEPAMASERLARLLAECSVEIAPGDALAGEELRELFAPGRMVFVGHPAGTGHHAIVAACERLRRAGFVPVPHLAARRVASFTQARDFFERAAAAGVEAVLLTGGNAERPAGPFAGALDLLKRGLVEQSGIGHVAFAGHPEGHARIAAAVLDEALDQKLALAEQLGLRASVVTQFGFAGGLVCRYVAGLRARGVTCPVRVGLAGPADVATLVRYAVRRGVGGGSLHTLARGHSSLARIRSEAAPEALLASLLAENDSFPPIAALHLFTFGGLRRAAEWLRAAGAA
jgi:methylenetetrahydrofolate reductase (NADPH)